MSLDALDPDSPEYDAALEAAQAEEDEANDNLEPQEENEEADAEAPSAVAEPDKTPEPTEAAEKPAGVASKDGSRVLPYAALQAERRAARQARGDAERAQQELANARQTIEDLKAGRTPKAQPSAADDDLTDLDLEEVAADFPALAKFVKTTKAIKEELAQIKGKATPTSEPEEVSNPEDEVQEAIDQVPLLSEWQALDAEKFARAVELDGVMRNSPKWRDKPMAARFAHVANQVADEYDIPVEDAPRTTSKPNRADPREVIQRAARATPNTLSDFKGGAVEQTTERLERMSTTKAVSRMAAMSDAEIDAHLAKFG